MKINRKQILKSPFRERTDIEKLYDSVLIVPAGTKHDSGFMHIAVIGVIEDRKNCTETYEICAYPDVISTFFPTTKFGDNVHQFEIANVRMDCYYPSGILRYHAHGSFTVSEPLSSVDIKYIPPKQ